ncbi:MAG: DUF1559 domain-containing protein, partial [Planctomycetota bacterium]|nr:DUF1559 domain-containing protein [Planctomycetota bacterium]
RQAARKTQSKNNLKQLGLAFHNYHDVYSLMPLGADVQADGTAKHGWYTRLIPYVEASDLYTRINLNIAWDHPVNDVLFKQVIPYMIIPGVDQRDSADGYGLLHYMANPNAMHRNHCISPDDMSTGTANNWLCGEVAGNYQPWGYPFNWRPLNAPLNSGPNSYGAWPDGGHLCLADGSVKFFSNATDATLLTSLANAPPVATKEQTIVPDHRIESTFAPLRRQWFEAKVEENWYKGTPGTTITFDLANEPYFADVYDDNETGEPIWDVDHTTRIDLQGVLEKFPEVRILNVSVVNDENAAIIAQFPNLEFLQAWKYDLTKKGNAVLKAHPKLKTIVQR